MSDNNMNPPPQKKSTTLSKQFQNTIERGKIEISNKLIHVRSLSWLGTGTLIQSGGVKLVCAQISPLS